MLVLPQTSLANLPAYLAEFDVCTVPFLDLPITRSMHPVKIYEYLAAGKHILAPALPEIQSFAEQDYSSPTAIATSRSSCWRRSPPASDERANRRSTTFAARNDWSERIDRLIEVVDRLRAANS